MDGLIKAHPNALERTYPNDVFAKLYKRFWTDGENPISIDSSETEFIQLGDHIPPFTYESFNPRLKLLVLPRYRYFEERILALRNSPNHADSGVILTGQSGIEAFKARVNNGQVAGAPAGPDSSRLAVRRPRMNVYEGKNEQSVTVSVELPGYRQSDIDIQLYDSNRVIISAMPDVMHEDTAPEGYIVREIPYGKVFRSFQLPPGIKAQWVDAKLENGVLKITFPKFIPGVVESQRIPIANQTGVDESRRIRNIKRSPPADILFTIHDLP
ncbi:hypothetical protein ONZ45_g3218 [Pleurotus djamor]|nr:hypothetical protein ONZ45_g3218 [Pleurotus djamor]